MGYRLLAYKLKVVLSCTFPAVQDGKSDWLPSKWKKPLCFQSVHFQNFTTIQWMAITAVFRQKKEKRKASKHTSLQMNWLSNSQKNKIFPSDLRWRELLTWSSALQRHHVPQPSSGPQVPQFDRPIVRAGQDQATTELQARHRRLVLVGTWKVGIITPWPLTSTSCLYMSSLSSQRYHFMYPFLHARQHVHLDITPDFTEL